MSLLEQARALHEDIEIIERAVYTELGDPSGTKLKRVEEIARDQVAATMIEAHKDRSAQLLLSTKTATERGATRSRPCQGLACSALSTSSSSRCESITENTR